MQSSSSGGWYKTVIRWLADSIELLTETKNKNLQSHHTTISFNSIVYRSEIGANWKLGGGIHFSLFN